MASKLGKYKSAFLYANCKVLEVLGIEHSIF